MSKEPGELAYETFSGDLWVHLPDPQRWHWARVESAIRADERAKVDAEIERLRAENIRLREALGEILNAVCSSVLSTVEKEKSDV